MTGPGAPAIAAAPNLETNAHERALTAACRNHELPPCLSCRQLRRCVQAHHHCPHPHPLREKIAPFRVIDTHAGEGLYDLAGEEASRTGEWRDGIGRLAEAKLPADAAELMAPYLAALRACNRPDELRYYPGSPALARHLMRPQDRLVACELEPHAAAALSRHLRGAATVRVVQIDGWIALKAYVPVKERRGLVIVDPPFEQPNDLIRLADEVTAAHRKWPTGIYLMWYPVKGRDGPDRFIKRLRRAGMEKCLRVEFAVASPGPAGGRA